MYTRKTKELGIFTVVSILLHLSLMLIFLIEGWHRSQEKFSFRLPVVGKESGRKNAYITYFNFRGNGTIAPLDQKQEEKLKRDLNFPISGGQQNSLQGFKIKSRAQGQSQNGQKELGLKSLRDTGVFFNEEKSPIAVSKSNGDVPVTHQLKLGELSYQWQGQLKSKISESDFIPSNDRESLKQNKRSENSTSFGREGSADLSNNASIGVVIPKGVKEEMLNQWQMVLYSFHKRVFSQFLTQLYLNAQEMERTNPYAQFPFSRTPDSVRVKATYDEEGHLKNIEGQKMSDTRLLNDFFFNSMNDLDNIPNPPKFIMNEKRQFELIFEIRIVN
ncbi:MAG: hypothetical protein QE271_05265 [Bacteriovoracaceae bacterium]|nr:hypothetical protein [Bacteriovoracaceae bacterium]